MLVEKVINHIQLLRAIFQFKSSKKVLSYFFSIHSNLKKNKAKKNYYQLKQNE